METNNKQFHTLKLYKVTKQIRINNIVRVEEDIFFCKTKKKALKMIESEKKANKEKNSMYEKRCIIKTYILTKYIQRTIETNEYIGSSLLEYKKLYF